MQEIEDDDFLLVSPSFRSQGDIPPVFHLPQLNGHDVFEISVDELQHLLSARAFTSEDYTHFCLDRVQAVNPYLECVIETNPDAMSIARTLDDERRDGGTRGPLHGIPVLVKDNMATADRTQTTAGSWALLGSVVPEDAHIVKLLRAAGAVILGKTNLDEWAGMRGSRYSAGFSARGGQCRNPFALERSPSTDDFPAGSSGGSAVSVSTNIVPLAFGTETDTSIIGPALTNGVVAIKPTVGLTSRSCIIPISSTQDSIGPYGRTVADAARALDIIAGPDPEDDYTTVPSRKQPSSYYAYLTDRHALKDAHFGIPGERFWDLAPKPQRDVVAQVLLWLREAGATLHTVQMPCATERIHPDGHWDWERYGDTQPEISEITVSKVECYELMGKYLSKLHNTPMRSLEDIVAFNDANRGSEGGYEGDLPAFADGQDLFRKCVVTKGVKDETYWAARRHVQRQCRENGIDAALQHPHPLRSSSGHVLDALLFCDIKMAGQCIAAQAGYPIIALPVGVDPDGMPVSLTWQHTAWEEGRLVRWGSAVEDLVRYKRKGRGRETPMYKNHLRKNIPVKYPWRYEGAPEFDG